MGAVRFSIDSGLVRELAGKLPFKVFVETGTYEGASTREMLPFFEQLHTIELSPALYAHASEAFADQPKVHVHHGSSDQVLAEIVPKLRRKSVLYWLDAHWCDEQSAGEDVQCPLLGELEAIGSVSDKSVVLIDDARLFMAPPPAPASTEGWPQFSEVLARLTALNPEHELLVIDDVLVFFPPKVREPLRDYAYHHAVDWLSELQVSERVEKRVDKRLEALKTEFTSLRSQSLEQGRRRADQLDEKVAEITVAVGGLETAVGQLGARAAEPQTDPALEERLAPLSAELESTGSQLKGLFAALEELGDQFRHSQSTFEERLEATPDLVGARVESVVEDLLPVTRRLRVIGKRLDELSQGRDEVRALAELVGSLGERLAALDERVEPLPGQFDQSLEPLRSQLTELDRRIEPLPERFDQRLEPLEARLAELADGLAPLRVQLEALDQRIEPLPGQFDQSLEPLRSQLTELDRRIEPLPERFDRGLEPLRTQLDQLAESLAPLHAQLAALDQRVEPLGAQLDQRVELLGTQLDQRVELLRAQLVGLDEAIETVRVRSTQSVSALGELPEARAEIAALSQRVDSFGTELQRLRPAVDRTLELQAKRSEATLAQLTGLRRQVRALHERMDERERRPRFARVRRFFARIWLRLFGPRLGRPDQHRPRKLKVPRRYRRQSTPAEPPTISVVTPADARPGFLDRTIRSVVEQDYEPLEYIVENPGGSKGTDAVLKRHGDRIARIEPSSANGKPMAALNHGLESAKGDVLGYVTPDHLLLPGALAYVATYFERHPDVDVVYGHRVLVDAENNEVGRWVLPKHRDETLSWADYVPAETLFWRRRVWEAIGGGVNEDLRETVDWDLLLRFREVGARMARAPRFLGAARLTVPPAETTSVNGNSETALMLARVHGREVPEDEAQREIRGYLRRHVMLQKLYRLHLLRY